MVVMTSSGGIKLNSAEATSSTDFNFAAAGDFGCASHGEKDREVFNAMASKQPEVVLGLGDYSYQKVMYCWNYDLNLYPTIHDAMHNPATGFHTIAIGNHEYGGGCPYQSNSRLTATNPNDPNCNGTIEFLEHFNMTQSTTYYSYNYSSVHFLVLDKNQTHTVGSAQYNFAQNDLAAARQNPSINWIVAYFHEPMYTSENNGSPGVNKNHTDMRDAFQPLFDQYKVDLVLQGHVHAYERMKPMNYDAQITDNTNGPYTDPIGQVYVTVGTGGRPLSSYSSTPAMSAKQIDDRWGFLNVEITNNGRTLIGTFYDKSDPPVALDTFTINKSNDAGAVYRSNTGAGLNTVKYREWNGTSGTWSGEVQLPTTGSAVREAKIYYSPISGLRIAMSLSQDGSINMFKCNGLCTTASNWVNVNGGRLAFANTTLYDPSISGKSVQYFDGAFETTSGRFVAVYDKNVTQANDFYWRTYNPSTGTLSAESGYDYTGSGSDLEEIRYLAMASNPSNNTIVTIISDKTNNKATAFVWNPSGAGSWGNQFTLTTSVPSLAKGIGVAFEQSSKAAVIFASVDSGSNAKWSRWTGSWASAQTTTPSASSNVRYITMKADPVSTSNKIMICIEGAGATQTIACAQENNNSMGSWTTHTTAPANTNRRNVDFCWDSSGSTGLMVYSNTTSGKVLYKTWSGSSWGTVGSTSVSGNGQWISCDTNPSSVDTIKSLWTKQDASNNIGALKWDGTNLTLISNNNPFTSSGGSTLEANGIAFQRSE
jgi:hypothetical protein